ncbi:hypothetical protein WDU94_015525 [Cyamophila willieti]
MSNRAIAAELGFNESTIRRGLKKAPSGHLGRYRSVLSNEQEFEIVDHCKALDKRFYGLSLRSLRHLLYQYAEENKIKHPSTKKILDLILVDPVENENMAMKMMTLSIFKNMVKHDACLSLELIAEYHLLELIESHLEQNNPKLRYEALTCLLELVRHGHCLCEIISKNVNIMIYLFCFCELTLCDDVAIVTLKILKLISMHSQVLTQHSAKLQSCLRHVLTREHCHLKLPILAIECLNIWNKCRSHTDSLVEDGFVDIMLKYVSANNTAAIAFSKLLSDDSNEACNRIMQNGLVDSILALIPDKNIQALDTIRNIAQKSCSNALLLVEDKCAVKVIDALLSEIDHSREKPLLVSCIHALENMCKYSCRHLEPFIKRNLFSYFNHLYQTNVLRDDIEHMFQQLVAWCADSATLEKLLLSHMSFTNPSRIFESVLKSFSKLLVRDCNARELFIRHDLLKVIVNLKQHPKCEASRQYMRYIDIILACYPPELVAYYRETFKSFILSQLETQHSSDGTQDME